MLNGNTQIICNWLHFNCMSSHFLGYFSHSNYFCFVIHFMTREKYEALLLIMILIHITFEWLLTFSQEPNNSFFLFLFHCVEWVIWYIINPILQFWLNFRNGYISSIWLVFVLFHVLLVCVQKNRLFHQMLKYKLQTCWYKN